MDESDQLKLMRIAKKIISDKFIPKDLQLVEMGQTLLFMLQSRKRNINQQELDSIELSGSLDNFQGFFSDNNAKQLFKITLEHFVFCIKKKACTQKDAEQLLVQAVINFKATELEIQVVKNYLISALKQGLGLIDVQTPRISDLSNSMSTTKKSGEEQKQGEQIVPKK